MIVLALASGLLQVGVVSSLLHFVVQRATLRTVRDSILRPLIEGSFGSFRGRFRRSRLCRRDRHHYIAWWCCHIVRELKIGVVTVTIPIVVLFLTLCCESRVCVVARVVARCDPLKPGSNPFGCQHRGELGDADGERAKMRL